MSEELLLVAFSVVAILLWAFSFVESYRNRIAVRDRIIVDHRDQLDSYARELAQLKQPN